MTSPKHDRLTIDQTVVYDFLYESRPRHQHAVALFAKARSGDVNLAIAPQGRRLDAEGKLAGKIQHLLSTEAIEEAPQLAYPSGVTYPADNLFPGHVVDGFREAWDEVIASLKASSRKCPGDSDAMHVETHVAEGRDFFITDDGPLPVMCQRLRDEHGVKLEALGLGDYMSRAT